MTKREYKKRYELRIPNGQKAPRLCPELAQEIGLNESIMLLQIDFLISVSGSEQEDGKWWAYESITDLKEEFPFWSRSTINRIITKLEQDEWIIVGNFNKMKYDRTRWFRLNNEKIATLKSVSLVHSHTKRLYQNGTPMSQNETRSTQNGTGKTQNGTTIPDSSPNLSTKKNTPNGVHSSGILEYEMVDETDSQFNCSCEETIIIATLANAGAECPKCFTPIRVKNWLGKVIKKPKQKARRQESGSTSPIGKFDQKPLQGFCALCGIPYTGIPVKRKKQWASELKKVADEFDANEEETYQAIKAIKDSEESWKTFTTPYQDTFKDVLAKMLMRVKSGESLESFVDQAQSDESLSLTTREMEAKRHGVKPDQIKFYVPSLDITV